MSHPTRNKLIGAAIAIVVLTICILPWRHNIDRTLQGVQCRLHDKEYCEDISVYVKGTYNQYLFRRDTYNGIIGIEGYDYTSDVEVQVIFSDFQAVSGVYDSKSKNYKHITVFAEPDFSKLLFLMHEESGWSGQDGLFISVPAQDRNQAIEVAKKLTAKSKWLSQTGIWE